MILVSTTLVPRGFDAITLWPVILVRPAFRLEHGLIEHELVHWREQMLAQLMLWSILALVAVRVGPGWWLLAALAPIWWAPYLLVPSFRLDAEERAFRRQIEVGGISLAAAAQRLSTRYRLNLTFSRAVSLLSED